MTNEKVLNIIKKTKDGFIILAILTLFAFPFLKQIFGISIFTKHIHFDVLKILGLIGVFFLILKLYNKYIKTKDKKQFAKELIPIFLLGLFMIWTLFSTLFAEDGYTAFYGTEYRKDGYISYLIYAGCSGLAFCLSSKKMQKILLYSFVIIAILTTIAIILGNSNMYFRLYICNYDLSQASFDNPNHYGYYLLLATAISSFLCITEKNKVLKVVNFIMYAYMLFFLTINNTFGSYLALIFTFIVFLVFAIKKKYSKIPIIAVIIVFILSSFIIKNGDNNVTQSNFSIFFNDIANIFTKKSSDSSWQKAGSGRMKLWGEGVKFIVENPILGYGPENIGGKYSKLGISNDRPHNLIIQLATTSGIPRFIVLY